MITNAEHNAKRDGELLVISQETLKLSTLERRFNGLLDSHTLSVGEIKEALTMAYEAGWTSGRNYEISLQQRG